jgi:hypothetical protein
MSYSSLIFLGANNYVAGEKAKRRRPGGEKIFRQTKVN